MEKRWVIKIKEQNFTFDDYYSASKKAIEMIQNGCWYLTLEDKGAEKKKEKSTSKKVRKN